MSVDKFGRLYENTRRAATNQRGPPGVGFILTDDNNYDMKNRRLINVGNPIDPHNALNLKYYLSSKCDFDGNRLTRVGDPKDNTDATNKAYVDDIVRKHEARIYESTEVYVNKRMNGIQLVISSDMNGIVANTIPNTVKTLMNEMIKEKIDDNPHANGTSIYNLTTQIDAMQSLTSRINQLEKLDNNVALLTTIVMNFERRFDDYVKNMSGIMIKREAAATTLTTATSNTDKTM
ncbi:hypothetical protein RN001_005516 [Aquatica leii]|uniref:Uncharacterized protein n=1 Tax=Aquatica leii TaxID=1421715 RepID=A0AAN7SHW4_9COLE|nr:hypothetical protein RN001_005516 [Aquatica leii]